MKRQHRKTRFNFLIIVGICSAQNPFITTNYTADPAARVFNDTLFLYTSHDQDTATFFNMVDWHVYSTVDMKNWTAHRVALSLDDISWASTYAWAPDCAFYNGKYYFYFPVEKDYIGVAVSNRPDRNFTDPLGTPLITRQTPGVVNSSYLIDPTIFIDDDNTPYLIFGMDDVNIVKLNHDMISLNDTVKTIDGVHDFYEAAWMHKYQNKYYLSYSSKTPYDHGQILYGTSDSPYGPFEYQGVILDQVNSGTNHHSIVEYKSRWYLFYHNSDLYFQNNPEVPTKLNWKGNNPFRRSINVDYLTYNKDGSIIEVIPTKRGLKNIE
ncbi:MAG: family 43 glycosylhydrolase [Candidatus Marinimicrobia bacterium]|nr:family 43 glycosylhydrolase [Candidatus Neomarinimicrobiota bacterium]MBL7010169.1 family 43 glycosylhydrolase [Candidatus Neomarinimicrobiota bacterium]MBL7030434.1 family 43 glycosylhydrolase [Candidatus Neomarinimicrobiota bacterium]